MLTLVMVAMVSSVSMVIHVYSAGYMAHDRTAPRFFAYMSLFTFAMLMLVTANNLLQLFFGWEGVGLVSYLLINYWYDRPAANAAAIKAFIVNRIGDLVLRGRHRARLSHLQHHFLGRHFQPPSPRMKATATRCSAPGFRRSRSSRSCCSSAPWASRRSFSCTPGWPTRWKARPNSTLVHTTTIVAAGVFMIEHMSLMNNARPGGHGGRSP